jgi:formylglycine-generating enzyme required for sulfatase activity
MKLRFPMLILFLAVTATAAFPPQAQKPLTRDQVMDLVNAHMEAPDLVKLIHEHGIDFDVTEDYVQALRNAGVEAPVLQALRAARPKPLTKGQVLELVAGHVASERAAMLVKQHGIDFVADEAYLETLRLAGGDDVLIAAVREAGKAVTAELLVVTSPDAEVYLDGALHGRADAQGQLALKARPGAHALKVSLKGKKDFEQSVTLAVRQTTRIEARLEDLAGSVRVQTSAGAEVFLDNSSRGSADGSGQLVIPNISPGSHELRVSARGRAEFRQSITVSPGQESRVDAALTEIWKRGLAAGAAMENLKDGLKYVWIPPGTFMMGCSPGDNGCYESEQPAHQVTITKGFWIGQTPVTVAAYKRFVGATGRQMPPAPDFNNGWTNENMPIVAVTWDEAQAYCTWMGGRLPTEAEWEYAARGGSTEARYGPIDEVAWYDQNSGSRTHDVGQKRANGFGLYDMLGNVWEWVSDWYDWYYYQRSPAQDAQGPGSGQDRVLRGGSWFDDPRNVRVSVRYYGGPGSRVSYVGVGLRCAGEAGIPAPPAPVEPPRPPAPAAGSRTTRENSKDGLKYVSIPPGTLRLFDPTVDAGTHTITLNGVDTAQPTTPFHFDWGDGTESVGFFPQTKVYQQSGRTYSIKVMATYPDGSHGSAETTATIP